MTSRTIGRVPLHGPESTGVIQAMTNRSTCAHLSAFAVALLLVPTQASASDFSGLMFIAYAITAIIAIPIWVVAYFSTRTTRSIAVRAMVWGSFIALVGTPLKIDGGNGTSSGPPLLNLVTVAFGADPVYGIGALKALVVSVPICIGLVALYLWGKPRLNASSGKRDGH